MFEITLFWGESLGQPHSAKCMHDTNQKRGENRQQKKRKRERERGGEIKREERDALPSKIQCHNITGLKAIGSVEKLGNTQAVSCPVS